MELASQPNEGRLLMARRPEPSEDERQTLLRSLTEVGPSKPVGYLPLYTIKDFVQLTPEAVAAAATARGLATAQFGPKVCRIKSGALYVYHREALANLLQARAEPISAAGLPLDPDRFVAYIAAVWFGEDHPAHPIIATVFGD
ncbi:hypothetical protein SAMN05519103_09566 [Rhizobiales bacterium GAS113]|nr:hypothetical protein SAMN05519103_09566 [Rhizobiales bacterium GAS113]